MKNWLWFKLFSIIKLLSIVISCYWFNNIARHHQRAIIKCEKFCCFKPQKKKKLYYLVSCCWEAASSGDLDDWSVNRSITVSKRRCYSWNAALEQLLKLYLSTSCWKLVVLQNKWLNRTFLSCLSHLSADVWLWNIIVPVLKDTRQSFAELDRIK